MKQHSNQAVEMFKGHANELNAAMYQLGLARFTPLQVVITERCACIVIAPPIEPGFVRGAMRRRETKDGVTRTVYTAPFHGCLLEWEVATESRAGLAAR